MQPWKTSLWTKLLRRRRYYEKIDTDKLLFAILWSCGNDVFVLFFAKILELGNRWNCFRSLVCWMSRCGVVRQATHQTQNLIERQWRGLRNPPLSVHILCLVELLITNPDKIKEGCLLHPLRYEQSFNVE